MSDPLNNTALQVSRDTRGVVTMKLNRPEVHNAFDDDLIASISAHLQVIAEDSSARVLILCSAGKSFSAGADLGWMQRMANYSYEENLADASLLAAMLNRLNTVPQTTIARIQGAAFGGAVGLAACCDIAIASQRASFSLSEVKLGLLPATISPYVLEAIGARACRRYFVTGERFDAQRACALGLVSEVVTEEELDSRVSQLTETLLANSPAAVGRNKQLLSDISGRAVDDALMAYTSNLIAELRTSEEGQEGLLAFLEKRSPGWQQ
jgi:methylglutaconyl-CoA hydratase